MDFELEDYWNDTKFEYPYKEKINRLEQTDIYISLYQKKLQEGSSKYSRKIRPILFVFLLVILFYIFFSLVETHLTQSTFNVIIFSSVFSLLISFLLSSIITNIIVKNKIKNDDEYKNLVVDIENLSKENEEIYNYLFNELEGEETKENILNSIDDFRVYLEAELGIEATEFLNKYSLFEDVKKDLLNSYEKEDYNNIIDILSDYPLYEYEAIEDWNDYKEKN